MSKDTQIQTFKGNFFDFEDLENNVYDIEDIAHALSNQCRWTGHTKFFFSVAQHSVLACDTAWEMYQNKELAYEALMHDASEYVLVDLSRPLKRMIPQYCDIQKRVERTIAEKFHFPDPMSPEIVEIDDRMLLTEYLHIIMDKEGLHIHPNIKEFFMLKYKSFDIELVSWEPTVAKYEFLDCYKEFKPQQ